MARNQRFTESDKVELRRFSNASSQRLGRELTTLSPNSRQRCLFGYSLSATLAEYSSRSLYRFTFVCHSRYLTLSRILCGGIRNVTLPLRRHFLITDNQPNLGPGSPVIIRAVRAAFFHPWDDRHRSRVRISLVTPHSFR